MTVYVTNTIVHDNVNVNENVNDNDNDNDNENDNGDVAAMWRRCGGDVAAMWRRCGGDVAAMWRRCGGNVAMCRGGTIPESMRRYVSRYLSHDAISIAILHQCLD